MSVKKIASKFEEYLVADKDYEMAITEKQKAEAEQSRTKIVREKIEDDIIKLIEGVEEEELYFQVDEKAYRLEVKYPASEDAWLDIDTVDIYLVREAYK